MLHINNHFASSRLDVYLWSQCKFFIGTTSGPTNVVISFHKPSLLLNCISNYAQSWNSLVVYVLKPFWSLRQKRMMKYSEVFTPFIREKMFTVRSMTQIGIRAKSNSKRDTISNY